MAHATFTRMRTSFASRISDRRNAKLKTQILPAVLALCICSGSVFAVSQTSSFRFLQRPGPYPVGLKVVDQYDRSRTCPASPKYPSKSSVGENARPLQTLIWYPSLKSTAEPMTVGDYTQLADTESRNQTTRPCVRGLSISPVPLPRAISSAGFVESSRVRSKP
jgi:hypothetical protein